MHEETLLQDLVRKVGEVERAHPGEKVRRVRIWVGALSHLNGATIRSRWPLAAQGTSLEFAEIEVETSTDVGDPRAQAVRLLSVDLSDA